MIATILVKEKTTMVVNIYGDSQTKIALYSRQNRRKLVKDKGEMESYYFKKMDHTASNYKFQGYNVFKRKFNQSHGRKQEALYGTNIRGIPNLVIKCSYKN